MKNETKESLYSMLDIMDAIASVSFMKIDIEKINRIRKDVLDVIGDKSEMEILDTTSQDLLGVLPMILLDNKKFVSVKEILNFAEKCLNIDVKPYWLRRSRAEVVGIIINEVYNQSPEQFNKFLKTWNEFNNKNNINEVNENATESKGFIEAWFHFFDEYKEKN